MTYGVYSISNGDTVQIDSAKSYSYLGTVQSGTGSSITLSNSGDMLFIKPASFPSTAIWGSSASGSVYTVYANTTVTAASYGVLRPTKANTGSTSGYGFEVYNIDGQLAFDSETFVSGTSGDKVGTIVRVIDGNGAYGNQSTIYTGSDYTDVYALVNSSNKTSNPNVVIHCFKWDQATTSILYASFITGLPFGGGAYFYNGSSIVLAKII